MRKFDIDLKLLGLWIAFTFICCKQRTRCQQSIDREKTFYKINGKALYRDYQQKPLKLSLQIRIHKEKKIWFLATSTLGLRVLRGFITPQKVVIINYLDKYIKTYDYSTLERKSQLPLNFQLIQALLLRETPINCARRISEDTKMGKKIYQQQYQDFLIQSEVSALFSLLKSVQLTSIKKPTSLKIAYNTPKMNKVHASFQTLKNQRLYKAEVLVSKLCIQSLEEDPGFPFKIPKTYDQK